MKRAWVDLDANDRRRLLISLVGTRYGDDPEARIDDIRAERAQWARRFVRLAGVAAGDTVVDLGSGCGFGTRTLAGAAARVIACDVSPAYLAFARAELADVHNVEFVEVEARSLAPLESASVDALVSMSVFIHLNLYDIALTCREIARVLKAGGRAVFDFADMDRLGSRWRGRRHRALFDEHLGHYARDPGQLPALMQWNSAAGVVGVARQAGLEYLRRSGERLVFRAGENRGV